MSSSTRAWMVAASIATVEALKDQGLARWNYTLRCLQHHAKNNIRSSFAQAKSLSSSSMPTKTVRDKHFQEFKQSEESLRKALYFNCWGPN